MMRQFLGNPRQLARFLALTFAILMIAAAIASMVFSRLVAMNPLLVAVASAVVAAWSINLYVDIVKYELSVKLMRRLRRRRGVRAFRD